MSVKVMSLVWERLGVGGGELLLALALADRADDLGGSLFESVGRLARKTRQSPRTVRRQLAHFRAMGWLQVVRYGGIRGQLKSATRYQINPLWLTGATLSGVPEATPVNLSPIEEKSATGGTPPLSPVTATPVTGVRQSVMIHQRSEERGALRTPSGRSRRSKPPEQLLSVPERIAAARAVLRSVPDYPDALLRKMYGLSDEQLAEARRAEESA